MNWWTDSLPLLYVHWRYSPACPPHPLWIKRTQQDYYLTDDDTSVQSSCGTSAAHAYPDSMLESLGAASGILVCHVCGWDSSPTPEWHPSLCSAWPLGWHFPYKHQSILSGNNPSSFSYISLLQLSTTGYSGHINTEGLYVYVSPLIQEVTCLQESTSPVSAVVSSQTNSKIVFYTLCFAQWKLQLQYPSVERHCGDLMGYHKILHLKIQ